MLNNYFFAKFVSYDGTLEPSTEHLIFFVQIINLCFGILLGMLSWRMKYFSPKTKERIINFSFLLFTIFFFFLMLELGVRIVFPSQEIVSFAGTDPAVFEESTIIPWTLKPNASARFVALDFDTQININSLGLRDKERSLEKDNNTYRILVLGDSFTYGFGVNNNETYSAILENLLNTQSSLGTNKKFEVWNAGFASGYTEDTFYLYLREKGFEFKPDMVLVGMYVENDVLDFSKNNYTYDKSGKLIRITSDFYHIENGNLRRGSSTEVSPTERAILYFKKFLLKYSRTYSYLSSAISSITTKNNNPLFDSEYSNEINDNFNKVEYYLSQIKKLGDENNITVAVILFPGKTSIGSLWQQYLTQNPGSIRDKPENMILSYCQNLNITCLDLWPYFTNSTDGTKYYFVHDAHWSQKGNQKGAEIIHQLLLSENMTGIQ